MCVCVCVYVCIHIVIRNLYTVMSNGVSVCEDMTLHVWWGGGGVRRKPKQNCLYQMSHLTQSIVRRNKQQPQ